MKRRNTLLALSLALGTAASTALAADFSFTGTLSGDEDIGSFTFTVGSASTVTLRTWSYAGSGLGTNAAGVPISQGGFDPILSLFDSTGALIAWNDDPGSSIVPTDSVSGFAWDAYLTQSLGIGTYTVSVTQYARVPIGPNLSNGFDPSLTTNFADASGVPINPRNGKWAADVLNVNPPGTNPPVPDTGSTWALLTLALGAVVGARRRLQRV